MKRDTSTAVGKNRWAVGGIALGLFLGVLMHAPARWVSEAVALATDQRVLLLNPQGTVWQGSADAALSDGQTPLDSAISPNTSRNRLGQAANAPPTVLTTRLHWQLGLHWDVARWAPGLQLALSSACCTPQPWQVVASPSWQGLQVQSQDHGSQWPAAWLVGLGAPWNTLQPDGQIKLRTQQLHWLQPWSVTQAPRLSGELELQWHDMSTRLSTLRPLGSYRVVVSGGDTMQLRLSTLEGSLQLQGSGEWLQGRLRFRGEASAHPDAQAAVSNLLNVLGQRRGPVSLMEIG